MPGRERRSLQPTANWQVWTMVFVLRSDDSASSPTDDRRPRLRV
jgi:hypothetical protein